MRFWIGLTDKHWFTFLRDRAPDEVNFWQPTAGRAAVRLAPGAPFLFKLHAPEHYIVGGGFYVRYSALPARLVWDAFGEKNGVADYEALRARVEAYRRERVVGDPVIGCHVLNKPFFWPESLWIPAPPDWSRNIVQGKALSTDAEGGAALWNEVARRLERSAAEPPATGDTPRFGAEYLTQARLGQGAFRVLVTDAYARRCAVSGERTLPVLEAAHIRPYADNGPHLVSNGLLLRSDLHTLFDRGYLTIDEKLRVCVSKRIREEFENGREYYKYDNVSLLNQPQRPEERPSADFLRWHNEHRFLKA